MQLRDQKLTNLRKSEKNNSLPTREISTARRFQAGFQGNNINKLTNELGKKMPSTDLMSKQNGMLR